MFIEFMYKIPHIGRAENGSDLSLTYLITLTICFIIKKLIQVFSTYDILWIWGLLM